MRNASFVLTLQILNVTRRNGIRNSRRTTVCLVWRSLQRNWTHPWAIERKMSPYLLIWVPKSIAQVSRNSLNPFRTRKKNFLKKKIPKVFYDVSCNVDTSPRPKKPSKCRVLSNGMNIFLGRLDFRDITVYSLHPFLENKTFLLKIFFSYYSRCIWKKNHGRFS